MSTTLTVAQAPDAAALDWACEQVRRHHYLRQAPDQRSRPLAYLVLLGGARVGCLFFGRTEATCCYRGGLTYGPGCAVAAGRAAFDRWEVLCLSRVWLSPDAQRGGRLCVPGVVPGFMDRQGRWQPAAASAAVRAALARVGADYLLRHPPCFLDQPYAIRAVLSYCDRRRHRGALYRACGFSLGRTNPAGVETWWTAAVAGLTAEQDQEVRAAAQRSARSRRIRHRAAFAPLFEE